VSKRLNPSIGVGPVALFAGDLARSRNQDPASTAWNLLTALYYKSGNIPLQLERVPQNTRFVGVSFYKESPYLNADMQSSLAQVFSGAGEGPVLKGERP
jgi:hypothetical protein